MVSYMTVWHLCLHRKEAICNLAAWSDHVSVFPQLRTSLCCRPLQPRTCSSSRIQRWCHGEHEFSSLPASIPLSFFLFPHDPFIYPFPALFSVHACHVRSFFSLFFPPLPPAWILALLTSPHLNLIEFVSCANGSWNATLILPVNVINVLISWRCSAC